MSKHLTHERLEDLLRLVFDEADPEERARIEAHVATCTEGCKERLALEEEAVRGLEEAEEKGTLEPVPASLRAKLDDILAKHAALDEWAIAHGELEPGDEADEAGAKVIPLAAATPRPGPARSESAAPGGEAKILALESRLRKTRRVAYAAFGSLAAAGVLAAGFGVMWNAASVALNKKSTELMQARNQVQRLQGQENPENQAPADAENYRQDEIVQKYGEGVWSQVEPLMDQVDIVMFDAYERTLPALQDGLHQAGIDGQEAVKIMNIVYSRYRCPP